MNAIQQHLNALKQWHATLSPRERAGLMALLLVAAIVAAMQAFDWAMAAQARATQAHAERLRMAAAEARVGDEGWRRVVAENAGRVWSWSVVEPTESIARARAVAELESLAGAAGVIDAQVRAARQDTPTPPNAPMAAMDYVIEGVFDWPSLLALLDMLDDSTLDVTPISMDVRSDDIGGRFTMVVRMAFLDEDART